MSSIERVGLSNDFTDLFTNDVDEGVNDNNQTNVIDNQEIAPNGLESTENSVTETQQDTQADNQALANDDGDNAELSNSGFQLAQNVDMNSPLSLE